VWVVKTERAGRRKGLNKKLLTIAKQGRVRHVCLARLARRRVHGRKGSRIRKGEEPGKSSVIDTHPAGIRGGTHRSQHHESFRKTLKAGGKKRKAPRKVGV